MRMILWDEGKCSRWCTGSKRQTAAFPFASLSCEMEVGEEIFLTPHV